MLIGPIGQQARYKNHCCLHFFILTLQAVLPTNKKHRALEFYGVNFQPSFSASLKTYSQLDHQEVPLVPKSPFLTFGLIQQRPKARVSDLISGLWPLLDGAKGQERRFWYQRHFLMVKLAVGLETGRE